MKEKEDVKEIKRYKLILNFYDDYIEKTVIEQKPFLVKENPKKSNKTTKNDKL